MGLECCYHRNMTSARHEPRQQVRPFPLSLVGTSWGRHSDRQARLSHMQSTVVTHFYILSGCGLLGIVSHWVGSKVS